MLAVLQLTGACNYRCHFCYVEPSAPRGAVSASRAGDALVWLAEAGATYVALSGGEPTLVGDLTRIVERARGLDLGVALLTNGSRPGHAALGAVDAVQVSVDGPEEVHDRIRGRRGAYRRALRCISELVDGGKSVAIQMTIDEANADYVEDVLEVAYSLRVSTVAIVAGLGNSAADSASGAPWMDAVARVVIESCYAESRTTAVSTNLCDAAVVCDVLRMRLAAAPLPVYFDLANWRISVGVPGMATSVPSPELIPRRLGEAKAAAQKSLDVLASGLAGRRGAANSEAVLRLALQSGFVSLPVQSSSTTERR